MSESDDGKPPGGWKVSSPLAGWTADAASAPQGAGANVAFDFAGQVAVVTGGSNGIGRAISERLRDAGADVDIWDLDVPAFKGVAHAAVDVTEAGSVNAAASSLIDRFGRIDILVNNAGFAGSTVPLDHYDPVEWRRIVDVNLVGVFEVCRRIVPQMRKRDRGRIVNIASLAGKEGTPNASAYSAAKAGVMALSKSLGKELAETDIRVNCVAPAAIETALLQQMSPEHVQDMVDKSPQRRLGTVDEVSAMVLWLCSDACTFNTGAVFDLSGGRATY
jgi:3-oxoacyl-[acyl-carrier protein] reductase